MVQFAARDTFIIQLSIRSTLWPRGRRVRSDSGDGGADLLCGLEVPLILVVLVMPSGAARRVRFYVAKAV